MPQDSALLVAVLDGYILLIYTFQEHDEENIIQYAGCGICHKAVVPTHPNSTRPLKVTMACHDKQVTDYNSTGGCKLNSNSFVLLLFYSPK